MDGIQIVSPRLNALPRLQIHACDNGTLIPLLLLSKGELYQKNVEKFKLSERFNGMGNVYSLTNVKAGPVGSCYYKIKTSGQNAAHMKGHKTVLVSHAVCCVSSTGFYFLFNVYWLEVNSTRVRLWVC